MRNELLAATALVAFGGAAFADTSTTAETQAQTPVTMQEQDFVLSAPSMDSHLATHLIGETVYTAATADAQSIGDINDIVISATGEIEGVVIGVGGFLGAGEKNVAIDFDSLEWQQDADADARLVLAVTPEQLEAAPAFDMAVLEAEPEDRLFGATDTGAAATTLPEATTPPASSDMAATPDTTMAPDATMTPETDTAIAPDAIVVPNATIAPESDTALAPEAPVDPNAVDSQAAAPDQDTAATDQTAVPQDLSEVDIATVSAEQLIGTTVYSAQEENVGAVGDVILAQDGMIDAVVLDVGGFLGLGAKPVAIAFDDLSIRADANGTLYAYTSFTREQLEGAADFDADRFPTEREMMLLQSAT